MWGYAAIAGGLAALPAYGLWRRQPVFDQLKMGYDENYCLNNEDGKLIKVGELTENNSRRKLEVFTTQVGMQLYTGAHNPTLEINGNKKFGAYSGVALETQHFPDAVNHKHFPNTILRPNEKYLQRTIYKFSNH